MDKTHFPGMTRTTYKSGLTMTSPIPPLILTKPDDGQHTQYDLESIHFRNSEKVQLARAVGVFHCYNIKETLD